MTGLRRKELRSLSPRSFNLKADPPTLRVEAAASKHRRKDVLPLRPELVVLLREWLKRLEPRQLLFPKLEREKTWFMVKKDLERIGIAYEGYAADGIIHEILITEFMLAVVQLLKLRHRRSSQTIGTTEHQLNFSSLT